MRTWLVSIDGAPAVLLSLTQYVEACEAAQREQRRKPVVLGAGR